MSGHGQSGSPTPSLLGQGTRTPQTQEMVITPKEPKVPMPEMFNSNRSKLRTFIIQVELYIGFYQTKFTVDTQRVL